MLELENIPVFVREWINVLPDDTAGDLWEWLDSDPDAIHLLISYIVESHHNLTS